MSISTELSRLQADRNTIRAKLVELGLATSTDNLTRLASAIESIISNGAVTLTVVEGESITIPAGYHNGAGTVTAVSDVAGDAEKYKKQSKGPITPTKKQQSITPDAGYYGLSDVIVGAIPDAYQDVSSTTATAADVLTGKVYVLANGTVTTGAMVNNGAVSKTLDATSITYTVPKGYHNGNGKVQIVLETKTVTPTKSTQTITPTTGKVLSQVTVNPIPAEYITTGDATATKDHILSGKTAYAGGSKVTGAMTNNGSFVREIAAYDQEVYIPKGYHDGTGKVSLSQDAFEKIDDSENIKYGVTILDVQGTFTGDGNIAAANVLEGKIGYAKGKKVTGTMPDYSAGWQGFIASYDTPVFVPNGYHAVDPDTGESGSWVELAYEEAVKIETSENIKYGVTILGSPGSFTGDGNIAASQVLSGKVGYAKGAKVTGTMPNNGSTSKTIDGLTTTSATIPAGYTSGGTVSLTNDIEDALAAI